MGKIVAFWSSVHGQPGTTSNMIALATITAMEHECKCLLMQTHFKMNSLEAYLIGSRESSRDIFMDIGIDGLARSIKLEPLNEQIIENHTIPLWNQRLTLLPGTTIENSELFRYDMAKTIVKIMTEAKKYYDLIFIDSNSGSDEISKLVLSQADLIAVNLCQNKSVLDHHFSTWRLKEHKLMYLIGSYHKDSSYNLHNLKALYQPFRRTPLSIIPYNVGFMDSLSGGKVMKYMSRNISIKQSGEDTYFMNCVREASDRLIRLINDKRGGMAVGS